MSKLENIKKENHFKIPENYFDYLPEEIMDRIHSREKSKERFFLLKPSIIISSLAVLSGIILLTIFLLKKNISQNEIILSDNDVQQIIDTPELYNISESVITEQFLSSVSEEALKEETNISNEEINSYLEENTDVNTIINEL
ncbi:MAG: hypothetical protein HY063_15350 [Bacteroidetes bacterium]|nr:hypothetical protein [Bacteroidota bacterium]